MNSSKHLKRKISLCLSLLIAVNACPMTGVSADSDESGKKTGAGAIEKAAGYLGTRLNADNSFGNSNLVNDTAYALSALKLAGKEGFEESFKWLSDNADYENTDITARLAFASGSAEYLDKLETKQNPVDYGFGLYPDYSSDVIDSVLVLDAVNATSYNGNAISGADICTYLLDSANEDGGFAYAAGNRSDPLLTAIAVYDIGVYLKGHGYDPSPFSKSVTYITNNITDSFADEDITATICKHLALSAMGAETDLSKVAQEVQAAQKENGSFADSISATYWAVKLLADVNTQPVQPAATTAPVTTTTATTSVTSSSTTAPATTPTTTAAASGTTSSTAAPATVPSTTATVPSTTATASVTSSSTATPATLTGTQPTSSSPVTTVTAATLVLDANVSGNRIDFSWNDISSEESPYEYQILRCDNDRIWNSQSMWDGKEKINVLNVYPAEPYLEKWMTEQLEGEDTSAGKGLIDITSVYFGDFNDDPGKYMYDESGNFKYDVIFFGSADCNGGFDLNEKSYAAAQKFADSGRGILFGCDTICDSPRSSCSHPYFNDFASDTGLYVKLNETDNGSSTNAISANNGILNNYPWTIGRAVNIPSWHSSNQYCINCTEWFVLDGDRLTDDETGTRSDFYLVTKNNFGMIQAGSSDGQTTDDERKVIANTLFYLCQRSTRTEARDFCSFDTEAPEKPEITERSSADGSIMLSVRSDDIGTTSEYMVKGISRNGISDDIDSNIVKHEVTSGLAGFVIKVTDSIPDSSGYVEFDENGDIIGLVSADENGTAVLSVTPEESDKPQYINIFAVDKANNISYETIIPVSELRLESSSSGNQVDLTWNDISSEDFPYDYQILRRENDGEWLSQSMWDGKERIRVLNIYPHDNYLETWMSEPMEGEDIPAGIDLMDISSVSFKDFNSDPWAYIYDENGVVDCDVIYFDGDNTNDLTDEAYDVVRRFADSGRGILFGHDTISGAYLQIAHKPNFNKFAEDLRFKLNLSYAGEWKANPTVNVVKKGVMTLFPWKLSGKLTIPGTHSSGQYNYGATEWMVLDITRKVDEETGGKDSFYLATRNNLGMIQTGHSRGKASDDERKVLANTLFYLYQRAPKTNARDFCFLDTAVPSKPEVTEQSSKNDSLLITVRSEDAGNDYEYMAKAVSHEGAINDVYSNIVKHKVNGGLAGFVAIVTDRRTGSPELVKYDENGDVIGLVNADENGEATITVTPGESANPQYIHIFAVDKADNISYETVVPVSEHETDLRLNGNGYLNNHNATLKWNNLNNNTDSFSYQVFRRTNGRTWDTITAWNEKRSINVLNVYPAEPYLEKWMTEPLEGEETSAGKDMIDVTSVYFGDFNDDPVKYMYDESGSFRYDVIFFGASEGNNGFDLNGESYALTRKFIDSGRGVLFGHDTICAATSSLCQDREYFNRFAEDLGCAVSMTNPQDLTGISSAAVVRDGIMTAFPWKISAEPEISATHSAGLQNTSATEWILLNAKGIEESQTDALDGMYLSTKNNLGLIQICSSTGQATDDEKKLLANTLFYLYQRTPLTAAADSDFYDRNVPTIPEIISSSINGSKLVLNVEGKDNPTVYEYYVKASSDTDYIDDVKSNIVKTEAKSGMAGFVVKVTGTLDSARDLIEYEDDNYTVKDITPVTSSGTKARLEIELDDSLVTQCVHIFSVDKANNISEELILPILVGVKLGDVDFDGDVDSVDASLVLAEYAKLSVNEPYSFNEKQFAAGDINENGKLDAIDASSILAYYAYMSTGGKLDDMREWLKLPEVQAG